MILNSERRYDSFLHRILFFHPSYSCPDRQSSTIRTTSLAILALAPSEKGKCMPEGDLQLPFVGIAALFGTLAALAQPQSHPARHPADQHATVSTNGFPRCVQTASALSSSHLIPSAAHKVRRRVVTDLSAVGFRSDGCRQNWACLGSQEEPKPSIK